MESTERFVLARETVTNEEHPEFYDKTNAQHDGN
jgi:hypothetical protein